MKNLTDEIRGFAETHANKDDYIICYGATVNLGLVLGAFKAQGIRNVCLCDGDAGKAGSVYHGITVLPVDAALARHPNARIFMPSAWHRPEMTGILVHEKGVDPERIWRYEPVERRVSCMYLEQHAVIVPVRQFMTFCCVDYGNNPQPDIGINGNFTGDYNGLLKTFVSARDKTIRDIAAGRNNPCTNCWRLKESYFFRDRQIRKLYYAASGGCNYDCVYCKDPMRHRPPRLEPGEIELAPFCEAAGKAGVLSEHCNIDFVSGEPTIHPNRSELFRVARTCNSVIFTNASVYSQELENVLALGSAYLCVSLDAGTRETYAKIKGRDAFDTVIRNLKKYRDASNPHTIQLKYIFLEDINDNEADVDGFLGIIKSIGVTSADISHDVFCTHGLTPRMKSMVERMEEGLRALNIPVRHLSTLTKTR